ncbi:MAG: hypothetical protein EOM53_00005 [Alphaproteobacteria bacterium]|nr:hypothetical protein [Alphaproteobacteria bacterium]
MIYNDETLFRKKAITKQKLGASSIRRVYKNLFDDAGLKNNHPHTVRHCIRRSSSILLTPLTYDQSNALEVNFGHLSNKTIDCSYGNNALYFQAQQIKSIGLCRITEEKI